MQGVTAQDIGAAASISGGLSILFLLIGLISWLLGVILFFKIWAMTNNVIKIKETLEEWLEVEHPVIAESNSDVKEKD